MVGKEVSSDGEEDEYDCGHRDFWVGDLGGVEPCGPRWVLRRLAPVAFAGPFLSQEEWLI